MKQNIVQFLKAFGFLLVVLFANPAIAFSSPEHNENNIESAISAEITADIQELFPSNLTVPGAFSAERIFLGTPFNFYFHSSYKAVLANNYIAFSRSIDPSLNTTAIIFPFHFFL